MGQLGSSSDALTDCFLQRFPRNIPAFKGDWGEGVVWNVEIYVHVVDEHLIFIIWTKANQTDSENHLF